MTCALMSASCMLLSGSILAHGGPGPGAAPAEGIIVTRHFTGIWDQVDHQSQGIALQVVEQSDDSRRAVAYWYTYGSDREATWYIGIGDLVDNRVEMTLYNSSDVGFLQAAVPDIDPVSRIGTMTIAFESCTRGDVTFETNHPEVGTGSFRIVRLLEVMNTHCSGGMSDDMHDDTMFGVQRIELSQAREGVVGNGHARYEDYPGHMEFQVEVAGLPNGRYHLFVGLLDRGEFTVDGGRGEMRFASPAEDGYMLLNFDPRGMQISVRDDQGMVLSSFAGMFEVDSHDQPGGRLGHNTDANHNYDCSAGSGFGHGMSGGMGGGMGGMVTCVDEGDSVQIRIDLQNTGVLPNARGQAEWEINSHRVMFSVEIEGLPVEGYPLYVGGNSVGIIDAFQMHGGYVYGHLGFRDPEAYGREHLDFEPRGQKIEVMQGGAVVLEVDFPAE